MAQEKKQYQVAVVGASHTGKSTFFQCLVGNQEGKPQVQTSNKVPQGTFLREQDGFVVYDLPEMKERLVDHAEQFTTQEFLLFEQPDVVVVVVDAAALSSTLSVALQVMEWTNDVMVCVNFLEKAKQKNLQVDCDKLEKFLGVPCIQMSQPQKKVEEWKNLIQKIAKKEIKLAPIKTVFPPAYEQALERVMQGSIHLLPNGVSKTMFFSHILEFNPHFFVELAQQDWFDDWQLQELYARGEWSKQMIQNQGSNLATLQRERGLAWLHQGEMIAKEVQWKNGLLDDWKNWGQSFGMVCCLVLLCSVGFAGLLLVHADVLVQVGSFIGEEVVPWLEEFHLPFWLWKILEYRIF